MAAHTVTEIQSRLIALGYGVGPSGADGVFGTDTQRAVMLFQTDHALHMSGQPDAATLAALFPSDPQSPKGTPIMGNLFDGIFGRLLNWQFIQGYLRSALFTAAGATGFEGIFGKDGTATIISAVMLILGFVVQLISSNTKTQALDVVKAVEAHPEITVIPAAATSTGKPVVTVSK